MTFLTEGSYLDKPWRTGRRVGHHIYAQLGDEPSDSDPPLGTLFSPALAAEAVEAHNERLRRRDG